MKKVSVIYWSGTGNTEKMADYIGVGLSKEGAEVNILRVDNASMDHIENSDLVVLGCSAMGAEVLEEYEMEPFVESLKDKIGGKPLGLFGSYDWGDGEWMRNWEARMEGYGAKLVREGLIIQNMPEDSAECEEFAKELLK